MKKDIHIPAVKDIGVAVVKELDEGEEVWNVYLVNFKEERIENVLVSSKGYGTINDKQKKTSNLNHFLGDINPRAFHLIEPISEEVFGLSNEYFVTFYIKGVIHDKKYVFVPEAIQEAHFTKIEVLGLKGVLIK